MESLRIAGPSAVLAVALMALAAAPAAASRGDGFVRGYVMDGTSGAPIAGATVGLEPQGYWGDPLPWRYELTTDGSGYFETRATPASYRLVTSHGAYASNVTSIGVGSLGTTWANVSLDPAADRAATLRGTVLEAGTGTPIAVGRIVASTSGAASGGYQNASALNASGFYEMTLVPGTYDVYTDGVVGYGSARSSYVYLAAGVLWLNFTLTASPFDAWINGTVYSSSGGAPIPNATVSAVVDGLYLTPATTDADGRYSLNVPEGSVELAADAVGYVLAVDFAYAWSGSTTYRDFYLAPLSGRIRGYVTNATSGAPVIGAVVSVSDFDAFYDQALTNESGYYDLAVPSDLLDLRATATGYGPMRTFAYLSSGETAWLNITLYPIIATVQGYAVDALTGAHISNLTVLVVDGVTGYSVTTTTDASGFYRARMTAVPILLAAISGAGAFAGGYAYGNAAQGGVVWLNVTVQRVVATVRVNVTDALTGAPIPGASVSLSWFGLFVDFATADGNGTALLDSPQAADVAVFATASGYRFGFAVMDVASGSNDVTIALFPDLPTDVTLRGYVTNETGAPIDNARIDVSGYDWDTYTAYADSTGYYEVPIVAAPQSVVVTASGHTGNETMVDPSPGEVLWLNVTLRPDTEQPVILSFRADPNASVSSANPTTLLADVSEKSPDWASLSLYRLMRRSGDLGTFIRVLTLPDESFEVAARGPDRYDVWANWTARAPGGWLRDASRSEWWPVARGIVAGAYTVFGSWTNGTETADAAYAAFNRFTGDLDFVLAPSTGILTPEAQPDSTFTPIGETVTVDMASGVPSAGPPVRGAAFDLGSLRLDFEDVVPTGTYGAQIRVVDHGGRSASAWTFFGVESFDGTPPVANAGADIRVDEDVLVTFDGRGSTDENGIANYTWSFDDGGPRILYGPTPAYTFSNPGTYVVTLTVRDAAGNVGTDVLTVTVQDVTPPIVSITAPSEGARVSGVIVVTADATDNAGVVRVEFFVDGRSIGNDTSAPFSLSFDTRGYGDGAHTIRVVAHDDAGLSAEASREVTVSNAGGGLSGLVMFGGIGLLALIAAAAAFLILRRRKVPPPHGRPEAAEPAPIEPSPQSIEESPDAGLEPSQVPAPGPNEELEPLEEVEQL